MLAARSRALPASRLIRRSARGFPPVWHVAQYWRFFRENRTVILALDQAALVDQRFADRVATLLEPDLKHLAAHFAGVSGRPEATALAISALWREFARAKLVQRHAAAGDLTDEEAIELLTDLTDRGVNGR